MRVNRRKLLPACALAALCALAFASVAQGLVIKVGNIILTADGGFSPTKLPKHENAPITIHGGGSVKTVSGELPPVLENINVEFDRHGSVVTTGLATCRKGQLEATTSDQARRSCPKAIVGKGNGSAVVVFPESRPIHVSSPITLFNAPPNHGRPAVFAHAYTTVPVPTTFVIPIVIEKIHKGVYGYRTKAKIPRIANGYGIPIRGSISIGKKWTFKGKRYSYVNARCETGHLQARVEATFKDKSFLSGVFIKPCTARG
jgi:hypothetical protein